MKIENVAFPYPVQGIGNDIESISQWQFSVEQNKAEFGLLFGNIIGAEQQKGRYEHGNAPHDQQKQKDFSTRFTGCPQSLLPLKEQPPNLIINHIA